MLAYPVTLDPDDEAGGFVVSFADIPEAHSQGDSLEEALAMAAEALETAMDFYLEDRRPVPMPSAPKAGQHLVSLPASLSAKLLLLNAMAEQKVRPSELARRMNVSKQEVNRLTDVRHRTRIDGIEKAAKALGKTLTIGMV